MILDLILPRFRRDADGVPCGKAFISPVYDCHKKGLSAKARQKRRSQIKQLRQWAVNHPVDIEIGLVEIREPGKKILNSMGTWALESQALANDIRNPESDEHRRLVKKGKDINAIAAEHEELARYYKKGIRLKARMGNLSQGELDNLEIWADRHYGIVV